MAHITHDDFPAFGNIGGLFNRLVDAVRSWGNENKVRQELSRLSDRELDDLGISRYMIGDIARHGSKAG